MPRMILVVDDSATVRQLIELNLRKIPDLTMVQAVDGRDALEKIKLGKPEIILTDINMPNMNGLELIAAIRGKDGIGDALTPIVVITTKGEREDTEKGIGAGATAYVTKPINGVQLIETVRSLLK